MTAASASGESTARVVPPPLLEVLCCPRCRARLHAAKNSDSLECANGHLHDLRSGYLDASSEGELDATTARTMASFGYEWNEFDDVRPEDEALAEVYFKDVDFEALVDEVALDAGCGKGRFTRVIARHLDSVVALDGSDAVRAAARNLASLPNVFVVKADLRSAPLNEASFGFVMCLGVLHHLDDPHEGFRSLVKLLRAGGQLLVYLYSRPRGFGARSIALACARTIRRSTVSMPPKLLRVLSVPVAWLLYATLVVPGRLGASRGIDVLDSFPMRSYRDKPLRSLVLDTFDRLSAPVEHRFSWEDIAWWFDEAGLVVDAHRDEAGWFVLAHKI